MKTDTIHYRRRFALAACCCWLVNLLLAQSNPFFETLTPADGLSQGFVAAIEQDDQGFLWFGTKNGLNRYDGKNFRVFSRDAFSQNSLAADFVSAICEHGEFLVLGFYEGGIDLFHKQTERVFHCAATFADGRKLADASIDKLAVDAGGNLWMQVQFSGNPAQVVQLKTPPGFWDKLLRQPELCAQLRPVEFPEIKRAHSFHLSANGRIAWVRFGLQLFRIETARPKPVLENLPVPFSSDLVFANDRHGVTWVRSGTHLYRQKNADPNAPAGQWDVVGTPFLSADVIWLFQFDLENRIWLGADQKLHLLPVPAMNRDITPADLSLSITAPEGAINVFTDQSGVTWLGTVGYGVHKYNPRRNRFRHFLQEYSIGSVVYAGEGDEFGLYVSSERRFWFHPENSRLQAVTRISENPTVRQAQLLRKPGGGWHLFYQFQEQAFIRQIGADFQIEKTWKLPLPQTPIPGSFFADERGLLWAGVGNQLARLDPATGDMHTFDLSQQVGSGAAFQDILKTPDGRLWLATDQGLIEGKPGAGGNFDFQIHLPKAGDRTALRHQNVACLLPDPTDPNLLWVGSKGGGLARLDLKTRQFHNLTTREGLPNDVIYGILPELSAGSQGGSPSGAGGGAGGGGKLNLWLSSNRGIIFYQPASGRIKNYTEEDGLPTNEMNTFAYGKTLGGTMVFGSVEGVAVFRPEDLADNAFAPTPLLTGIEINNQPVVAGDSTGWLDVSPSYLKKLTLPFAQNSVTFSFAMPEFSSPEKNRFRYYLEGAEKPWAHENLDTRAAYLNLPPGSYVFHVMAANRDGIWCAEPARVELVILPPWYRSWWAWLLWLGLAATGVWLAWRFRENRLRMRHALDLESREAARLKEMDSFKNRLFTNITHEFRTPLTVILGNLEIEKLEIEKLKQLEIEKLGNWEIGTPKGTISQFLNFLISKISISRRNGENLLRLINQILDLSKLESNSLKINYVQGDVLPYVRYVAESLQSLANAHNLQLRVESAEREIVMDYDPERLQQILYNLLSNAIKFTPSGGRVTLRASVNHGDFQNHHDLSLVVTDTGAGIPAADLPHIFDRFYQANNLEKAKAGGTGIGLALTKELVKAMGGEILVESQVGKGTTFTVRLPISNQAAAETLSRRDGMFVEIGDPAIFRSVGTAPQDTVPTEREPGLVGVSTNMPSLRDDAGQPQILIVEDNPDVVEYVAACLNSPLLAGEGSGVRYRLDFAYNGKFGIEKALEIVPDLIISDVMMPEKDGFELCDALKNDERTSHVPIVLLTAKADVESRIAGLRRGADAYLAKPFHKEELLVTLQNLLELRRKLQAKYQQFALLPTPPPPAEPAEKTPRTTSATLPLAQSPITHHQSPITDTEDEFISKIKSIIEAKLDKAELSAEDICRQAGMSQTHLNRKLNALTGMSIVVFMRKLRLHRAKNLLADPALNVSEVAYEVGFTDPKYFSRAFSEEFGKTPGEWRRGN